MIQGLRTVIDQVPDLEAAKSWYTRVLGSPPYFSQPYYVGFHVGGFELGLDPDMSGAGSSGGVAAYRGVADARAAYERPVELGARPLKASQDVREGIRVAVVADPFGNPFGIIENPHFSLETVR